MADRINEAFQLATLRFSRVVAMTLSAMAIASPLGFVEAASGYQPTSGTVS